MTEEEVHAILLQVTEEILERMRRDGFRYRGRLRFDPTVWDISNGFCEDWALRAAELLSQRGERAFTAWIDPDVDHCVLVHDGKFYDADCPGGVDRWSQLPMFSDPMQKRPEP